MTDLREIRPSFNGSVRLEGRPERLTSSPGALVLREVIERLDLGAYFEEQLLDPRDPELVTHPFQELILTMVLLFGQGFRDQDDADWLRHDAAMKLAASARRGTAPLERRAPPDDGGWPSKNPPVPDGLASQPTLSRLVSALSSEHNRRGLRRSLLEVAARRLRAQRDGHRIRYVTIDLDSLPIEVHGSQEGSAYNGHYHARIFHPLIASIAETGDLLDMKLREGTAHTAAGGLDFLLPLLDQVEGKLCQVASVRIDAGFPEENLLAPLEQRRTGYVARVKNNAVLNRMAEPFLKRPPGRRPQEPRTWFYEMTYQAESWSRERRVVLVVLEREGELFLHHFWLITNWTEDQVNAEDLLAMYRRRGVAEGHFGELMSVLHPALSSAVRTKTHYRGQTPVTRTQPIKPFANNEVLMLLHGLAYNVMHCARVLTEQASGQGWGLQRFRDMVLRAPARIIVHAHYATVVLGEATAALWQSLWSRLTTLHISSQPG
jgi:hypothetical protein